MFRRLALIDAFAPIGLAADLAKGVDDDEAAIRVLLEEIIQGLEAGRAGGPGERVSEAGGPGFAGQDLAHAALHPALGILEGEVQHGALPGRDLGEGRCAAGTGERDIVGEPTFPDLHLAGQHAQARRQQPLYDPVQLRELLVIERVAGADDNRGWAIVIAVPLLSFLAAVLGQPLRDLRHAASLW